MKDNWTELSHEGVPFLKKTPWLYIFIAVISLVIVLFFNAAISQWLSVRSSFMAVLLLFILPLLAVLTTPIIRKGAKGIGFIYAVRKRDSLFWQYSFLVWGISMTAAILVLLVLLYLRNYKGAAGVSNWIYTVSFLTILVNLIPEPPPSPEVPTCRLSIGLWGPGDSGKTVFLGMLYSDPEGRRWKIDITQKGISNLVVSVRNAFKNETWPERTQLSSSTPKKRNPLVLSFSRPGIWYPYIGLKYISVEMEDVAGKLFDNPSSDDFIDDKYLVFYKLARSDGALFILDHHFSENQEKIRDIRFVLERNLERMLEEFKPKAPVKGIPFPVAIVIAKIDEIYSHNLGTGDDPVKLFRTLFGDETLEVLEKKIQKFRIFCASSIGVKEGEKGMVPRTHRVNDAEVPDNDLEPFGLFEPLEWLLNHARRYAQKEKIKKLLRGPVRYLTYLTRDGWRGR